MTDDDTTTLEPTAATTPGESRRAILSPYLEQLDHSATESRTEVRLSLARAVEQLSLDGWERSQLDGALAGRPGAPAWTSLFAEVVALHAAALDRAVGPAPGPATDPDAVDETLVRLCAVGIALTEELQRHIDAMVVEGEIADAKRVSSFRNKLVQNVARLREICGSAGSDQAMTVAAGFLAPQTLPAATTRAQQAEPNTIRRKRRRTPQRRVIHDAATRIIPLMITLGVVLAIWAVFIVPRFNRPTMKVLTSEQLPRSKAVVQYVAKPPSLFVKVDGSEWREMTTADREEFVGRVGDAAFKAGYSGAQFRTMDGTTVAHWFKKRGTVLTGGDSAKR